MVWQWFAPDLWRRFTIALHRSLAHHLGVPAAALPEVATVQYAKVAEFQRRGAVHFHALIRLDGSHGYAAAPGSVTADYLAELVTEAARSVQLGVPAVDADDVPRRLVFGRQLDVRIVRTHRPDDDQALTAPQVAGYLAKYATKTATDDTATTTAHHRRLQATVADLDLRARVATLTTGPEPSPYELLGRWRHMLGFRGHFATKSRRYSITLGQLRRARQRAQARIAASRASGRPLDLASLEADILADEEETTLVVGRWSFLGSGWANDGERALATAAAAHAREYAQEKAQYRQQDQSNARGTGRCARDQ